MSVDFSQTRKHSHFFGGDWLGPRSCLLAIVALAMIALPAGAQQFSILNSFTGGGAGNWPYAGVTMDHDGNLYGTTGYGGVSYVCGQNLGCGLVYKLERHGSGWTLFPLYAFKGGSDGYLPASRVVFGPDGALYGTTEAGAGKGCGGSGCGIIYRLTPPATICEAFYCPWTETILHTFNGSDGSNPIGDLTFDQAGNIYGTTQGGGSGEFGTVFQLTHASGQWVLNTLLNCTFGTGGGPQSGVIFDQAGNLYGTTNDGGNGEGVIYELNPVGSQWVETILYAFTDGLDGGNPSGGLIFDAAGNLYGATFGGGAAGRGTVYELEHSGGKWTINPLASFPRTGQGGGTIYASLTWDPAGNLYGVSTGDGPNNNGFVFELSPSNGGWTYTDLYDFPASGGDPYGTLLWNNGSLIGTTFYGGTDGLGTVFEVTP